MRRFLNNLNLFATDDTDERTLRIQQWSTRVYICVLFFCMCVFTIQHGLRIETRQIEVKNPSFETYVKLRSLYTDINCPCSQISTFYELFVTLIPTFHPICSSKFLSQQWIEMLVDNMTSFRFPGDFRATASTQFQVLRELCNFLQLTLENSIQSFFGDVFISGNLLDENQWRTQIETITSQYLNSSITDVQHKILFIRSFVINNLLVSGIQTPISLLIEGDNGNGSLVINSEHNIFTPSIDDGSCTCDRGGTCYFPSSFYNVTMTKNEANIAFWTLQSQLSLVLSNWFVGCWALESLFLSSFNASFLYNQTELDLIIAYFNWSSDAMIPKAINLTGSNMTNSSSSSELDDLVLTSFVVSMLKELNYTAYFQQCQAKSCFYSVTQHSDVLYIITSLLALYGGLSIALQFLVPYIVAFLIERLTRQVNDSKSESISYETVEKHVRIFTNKHLVIGPVVNRTWRQRTQRLVESVTEINLFESSIRRQPSDIKQQRWTTRIHLLCLSVGFAILMFYAILTVQKKSIEVPKPTLERALFLQLHTEFNASLQCPCTQINIIYGELVQLQPTYHQICSSFFIGQSWLYYISATLEVNADLPLNKLDFRRSYQSFYLLNKLCDLGHQTVISSLLRFEQTELITANLLSTDLFENQMNSNIQNFQSELIALFLRFSQMTRIISYVNQYFNNANIGPFEITSWPYSTTFSINNYQGIDDNTSYSCSCAHDINCKSQLGLYNRIYLDTPKSLVPGLYIACSPMDSLLQSTLECFYDNNQHCLTNIVDFYNENTYFTNFLLLNSSLPSRFLPNNTVDSLLQELFIEYWNQSLNYSSYFALCQPAVCTYNVFRHNSALEIATIVLGLLGGLSVSIHVLVPFAVTLCFSLIHGQHHQHTNGETRRFIASITRIKNWFTQINVFDNPKKTTGNDIQKQQRATYIYLLLLSIALIILLMYNSLIYISNTFTVTISSLEQYKQLQEQYDANALNCPCSQVSISYSSFLDVNCNFHPVCSSYFISDLYLQQLFEIYNGLNITDATNNAFTLPGTAFAHFQALRTLCNLVNDSFKDTRQQYLNSSIISASMMDYKLFDDQMNSSLARFRTALPNEFLTSLQLVRGMVQGNALVSLYSTNWYPVMQNWRNYTNVYMQPQYYGNCSCFTSPSCTQPSNPPIPGYLVGCTPLESLLQSSIECLYKQTCINNFTTYLGLSLPGPGPIDINETHFTQQSTIETVVEQMFIERCSSEVSYDQFFGQCYPKSCSITLTRRNSLAIVITILLGLYGGLTIVLKLVAHIFISFIYTINHRRRQIQVHPQTF